MDKMNLGIQCGKENEGSGSLKCTNWRDNALKVFDFMHSSSCKWNIIFTYHGLLGPMRWPICKATYYWPKILETQKNSQSILQFSEFTTWWVVSDEGVDLPFYFHHSQLITWRVVTKIVDYFMSLVTDEWMHYPTISICFIKGFVGPKRLFFFFQEQMDNCSRYHVLT